MSVTHFCIVGERVSGTCYLQKLLTENTRLKPTTEYGHKHFFQDLEKMARQDTAHILFIFISRDMVEWLQSFFVNTFHADLPIRKCNDFSKFIRMEWKCIHDSTSGVPQSSREYGSEMMFERDPSTGKRFSSVIHLRSSKNRHFMSIKNIVEHFIHVQYENVRDFPEEFIESICFKYGIVKSKVFSPVPNVRGKGSVPYVRKNYPDISREDAMYIAQMCDQEMETALGYL